MLVHADDLTQKAVHVLLFHFEILNQSRFPHVVGVSWMAFDIVPKYLIVLDCLHIYQPFSFEAVEPMRSYHYSVMWKRTLK